MNKLIIIFILGGLVFSCKKNSKQDINSNDYLIITKIVTQAKEKEQNQNKALFLSHSNDNEYIVSILEKLYKYEKINDSYKSDSLKHKLGIIKGGVSINNSKAIKYKNVKRDSILDLIFNEKEYEYLISQKEDSVWDLNLIDKLNFNESKEEFNDTIHVGKPIYNQNNNFALVYFYKSTRLGISIYKKEKSEWIEYQLIAPLILQAKAEKFN